MVVKSGRVEQSGTARPSSIVAGGPSAWAITWSGPFSEREADRCSTGGLEREGWGRRGKAHQSHHQGSRSDLRRTIDGRPEACQLRIWGQLAREVDDAKAGRGRRLGAKESEAGMAPAEVENRRAAVLGAARFVPVPIRLYVSQMALGQEVSGILHDLDSAGRHGQGEHESTDLGAPGRHRLPVYATAKVEDVMTSTIGSVAASTSSSRCRRSSRNRSRMADHPRGLMGRETPRGNG